MKVLSWLLVPCALWAAAPTGFKTVQIKTKDGWTLEAFYRNPSRKKPLVLLLHGAASVKEEWTGLSQHLRRMGWGVLALDLRGHGASTQGPNGKTTFKDFQSPVDWINMNKDVEAALAFLEKKGIKASRIGLMGASLGANLASQAASAHAEIPWAVLLSPGFEYHWIAVARGMRQKRLIFAASPKDSYAFQTCSNLMATMKKGKFIRAAKGHGVQMFEDPEFMKTFSRLLSTINDEDKHAH